MITCLDHVAIAVADWGAAVSCYEQLLGRAPQARQDAAGRRVALFALRNTRIVLLEAGGEREGVAALGLGVADAVPQLRAADSVSAAPNSENERAGAAAPLGAAGRDGGMGSSERERAGAVAPLAAAGIVGEVGGPGAEHAALIGAERAWSLDLDRSRGLPLLLVQRSSAPLPAADSFSAEQVDALDHVVIRSAAPEQAVALYRGTLGIRLALDRELAGTRMLFFRTGGVTLEVIADAAAAAADSLFGLAYRVRDLGAVHARLKAAGFELTEAKAGRKPGTHVFSVRSSTCGVPTLFIRDPSRA